MSDMNFSQYRAALVALGADLDKSAMNIISRMSDVGIAETKKNTPVGVYPVKSGKVGGNLRRGWIKGVTYKVGKDWQSGYYDNVAYGLYVNNGHRIVGKGGVTVGYVKGRRMLEQGIDMAKRQGEPIFENEITKVKAKTGF
jgi:hypothetical protein